MDLPSGGSGYRSLWCFLWGVSILTGLSVLTAYSNSPAEVVPQASRWAGGGTATLASDRPTMVVTLHPHCACSRATLTELARVLADARTPVRVQVLLYQPAVASAAWAESDLTSRARSMAGVEVVRDVKGMESERFGMSVSGQTAVYAPDGRLLFSGGITRSRGHVGDSAGRAAMLSVLSRGQPLPSRTPVFGCSIRDRG